MTYWVLIPATEDREKMQSKVIRQIQKPKPTTKRVKNYPWIHGFDTKNGAIEHLSKMQVLNRYRPKGFKTYDLRTKRKSVSQDITTSSLELQGSIETSQGL